MTSQGMDEHGLQATPVRLLEALNRKARYRLPPGGQLVESFGLSRVPANAPVWRDRRQTHRGIRRHQVKGHAAERNRATERGRARRARVRTGGGEKENEFLRASAAPAPTRAPYLRLRRKSGRVEVPTPRTKKSGP
eukprot:scaffold81074_cov70-Phaeocystis_antarctica.AAC.7